VPLSSVADFFMTLTTVLFVPFAKFMRRLCSYCCLGFASCRLDFDTPLLSLLYHNHRSLPVPLPSTNPLTLPWLPYTSFNPSCHFPFLPSLSPLQPLSSFPSPFFPPLSLSFLEDVDGDAFLDCSHEYRGFHSDVAYFLSAIFCDALLPLHSAVNWSECSSPTLV